MRNYWTGELKAQQFDKYVAFLLELEIECVLYCSTFYFCLSLGKRIAHFVHFPVLLLLRFGCIRQEYNFTLAYFICSLIDKFNGGLHLCHFLACLLFHQDALDNSIPFF
jgi:hypothetical protein